MKLTTSFWRFRAPLAALIWLFSSSALAAEPRLEIQSPQKTVRFTRTQLLRMAEKEELVVEKDPAYGGKPGRYRVVAFHTLLKGVALPADATIEFRCLDGFSAVLSTERLLNPSPTAAKPYVAIEDPRHPWKTVKPKQGPASAGPFYLIWKNPQASNVTQEEWPYQLAAFVIKASLRSQYPGIFPSDDLPADHAVQRGFASFTKTCFACHTMNGEGSSQMGPDLNIPFGPTEYLKPGYLARIIRNPQSLRQWPQSKMTSLGPDTLSDIDIENIEAYLTHMTSRKKK